MIKWFWLWLDLTYTHWATDFSLTGDAGRLVSPEIMAQKFKSPRYTGATMFLYRFVRRHQILVHDGSASSAGQPRKDVNEDSTPDALSEATVTISPPSSAGQRLDGSVSVAEEPSPATSSEAAVTDGSASSAGQLRKDLNEDSTPDALSEATVTISPPSSAGQRLDGSVSVAEEPSPAASSEAAVTDGSPSSAGQPRKDFNKDSTPDALSEATVTISPPSSAGQRLDGSVSVAEEPSPATSSEADGSPGSAEQPRKDLHKDSTPDALLEATVIVIPPSSAGQPQDDSQKAAEKAKTGPTAKSNARSPKPHKPVTVTPGKRPSLPLPPPPPPPQDTNPPDAGRGVSCQTAGQTSQDHPEDPAVPGVTRAPPSAHSVIRTHGWW